MRGRLVAGVIGTALAVPMLGAQERPPQEQELAIPASAMPPEGMCRVWLRNVPERQQPAPTDCLTAIRTRPRDGVLLLGEPTRNAQLPPRRATAATRPPRGGLWDDPLIRRSALRPSGVADRMPGPAGANTAAPATRAGPQAVGAAASVKAAEPGKAAVVKPPEPPEQPPQSTH